MDVESFLTHHGIQEHPFRAEEARDDPVFGRLLESGARHPDFEKVRGQMHRPSASVVFGEKGSGKTAMRLLLEQHIARHNIEQPDQLVWVVRYDDLNPVLDRFALHQRRKNDSPNELINRFRLADHMDAILSRVVTHLVDALLRQGHTMPTATDPIKLARKLPRSKRYDLAVLALLYDQPDTGEVVDRWARLKRVLRVGRLPGLGALMWASLTLTVAAIALGAAVGLTQLKDVSLLSTLGACVAGALLGWGVWIGRHVSIWRQARKMLREVRVVHRTPGTLQKLLGQIPAGQLAAQPLPLPDDRDSRYQLTRRLLDVLKGFDYVGLVVLVDRVDEPAMINGEPERMRSLIWPMLNNKFLQQDGVGLKLLLPIELRHLLRREAPDFFQKARLDKQHMIDRLEWSGATLYDLCTRRLTACQQLGAEPIALTALFDEDVRAQDLIDALDQMHQPRDAFKFLYQIISEHCSNVPHDRPIWRIPRLTLEQVRKVESQRVQDLHRGLSPS